MDPGTEAVFFLSLVSVAIAIHAVAWPRPGRFMLVRVADAERHRPGALRVLVLNVLACLAACVTVLVSRASVRPHVTAMFAAMLAPAIWMLVELRLALVGAVPPAPPSRFRIPLDAPPPLGTYLSPPLQILNGVALVSAPVAVL